MYANLILLHIRVEAKVRICEIAARSTLTYGVDTRPKIARQINVQNFRDEDNELSLTNAYY